MDKQYFEAKVRYERATENGNKAVTESFLVNAENVEATEKRVHSELAPFVSGEINVKSVTDKEFTDVLEGDGEYFWHVTTGLITVDEKSGKEKMTRINTLLPADEFSDALEKYIDFMKDSVMDYTIISISRSKYADVYL